MPNFFFNAAQPIHSKYLNKHHILRELLLPSTYIDVIPIHTHY